MCSVNKQGLVFVVVWPNNNKQTNGTVWLITLYRHMLIWCRRSVITTTTWAACTRRKQIINQVILLFFLSHIDMPWKRTLRKMVVMITSGSSSDGDNDDAGVEWIRFINTRDILANEVTMWSQCECWWC